MKKLRFDRHGAISTMHARSTRLVRILRLLQLISGSHLYNVRTLAMELQVNRRTIYRDLNLLRESGLEIKYNQQTMSLHSPNRLPAAGPFISPEDLLVLALASHLSPLNGQVNFSKSIRAAIASLETHLPEAAKLELATLLRCTGVTADVSREYSSEATVVETIVEAIRLGRAVRLTLAGDEVFKQTKVAPYRLEFGNNCNWIIGRSSVHRGVKRFSLREIQKVEILDDNYEMPSSDATIRLVSDRPVKNPTLSCG